MLKKTLTFITVVSIIISCIYVSASSLANYSISLNNLNKRYTVITPDNISGKSEYLESIGFTVQSFKNIIQKKNIVCFIGNSDNSLQMQIICTETDLSKKLYTLENASDEELSVISKGLTGYECEVQTFAGTDYFYLPDNSDGNYEVYQYITVKNGLLYTVSFYITDKNIGTDEIEDILSSVKINTLRQSNGKSTAKRVFSTIFVILLIIAFATAAVITVIGIYNDIKRQNEVAEADENLKIKRRNVNIFKIRRK